MEAATKEKAATTEKAAAIEEAEATKEATEATTRIAVSIEDLKKLGAEDEEIASLQKKEEARNMVIVEDASEKGAAGINYSGIRVCIQECEIKYQHESGAEETIWSVEKLYETDAALSDSLQKELVDNEVVDNDGDTFDGEKLLEHVQKYHPSVNKEWFCRAVQRAEEEPLTFSNSGEMILQTSTCAPFSYLLHSMSLDGFIADQTWSCPLSVGLDDKLGEVMCQPDAGTTFSLGFRSFAFCLGLMKIKPESKGQRQSGGLHSGDVAKCVLTTSCAAKLLERCKVSKEDIAVPFLAVTGNYLLLGVTRLDSSSRLFVNSVFERGTMINFLGKRRLATFAYFAVLLAKQYKAASSISLEDCGDFFEATKISADRAADGDSSAVKEVSKFTMTAKRKRQAKPDGSARTERANQARLVASCASRVINLRFPL